MQDSLARAGPRAAGIDEQWSRGGQNRAAANTIEHADWLHSAAERADTPAAAAESHADDYDHAKAKTPAPQEFQQTRQELANAQARMDPIGAAQAAQRYATPSRRKPSTLPRPITRPRSAYRNDYQTPRSRAAYRQKRVRRQGSRLLIHPETPPPKPPPLHPGLPSGPDISG